MPVRDVATASSLAVGEPVFFDYPDERSPAVLLRLGSAADGGVGPDGDIVAFSLLCTHKGCPVTFHPDRSMMICPCHWSTFDPAKGGTMVIGQASSSLPQIELRLQDAMVQAVGVSGLIYGRHTNLV